MLRVLSEWRKSINNIFCSVPFIVTHFFFCFLVGNFRWNKQRPFSKRQSVVARGSIKYSLKPVSIFVSNINTLSPTELLTANMIHHFQKIWAAFFYLFKSVLSSAEWTNAAPCSKPKQHYLKPLLTMKESGDKTCCATKSQFAEHLEGEGLRRDGPPWMQPWFERGFGRILFLYSARRRRRWNGSGFPGKFCPRGTHMLSSRGAQGTCQSIQISLRLWRNFSAPWSAVCKGADRCAQWRCAWLYVCSFFRKFVISWTSYVKCYKCYKFWMQTGVKKQSEGRHHTGWGYFIDWTIRGINGWWQ